MYGIDEYFGIKKYDKITLISISKSVQKKRNTFNCI